MHKSDMLTGTRELQRPVLVAGSSAVISGNISHIPVLSETENRKRSICVNTGVLR